MCVGTGEVRPGELMFDVAELAWELFGTPSGLASGSHKARRPLPYQEGGDVARDRIRALLRRHFLDLDRRD